jgi:hypothetical protein
MIKAMNTVTKPSLEKVREALDVIDEFEASLEQDGLGPMLSNVDIDAWFERNHEALEEMVREGDAAIARGDYRDGTASEHLEYFLDRARRRRATNA